MTFTRLLKVGAYLLAALCMFGIATQIVQFGRPFSREHQEAVETWRKEFSDALKQSHMSSEASQRLVALYEQLLDERERQLRIASQFMAIASTVVVGLLSITAFLWCRIRVLKSDAPNRR